MATLFSYGFLAPPTVFIVLSLAGVLLALIWRRAGLALALVSSLCLYAAATPALSTWLLRSVEGPPRRHLDFAEAQAIVVLGGDIRNGDSADNPDTLGPLSWERVALAAQAWRRLHVPVVVSGGEVQGGTHASEAALMKMALEGDFSVPVAWAENRSRTTWENALYTARLVQPEKITTVVLVSQAWHLPRAEWAFERVGLKALPWPAPRTALAFAGIEDVTPNVAALCDTFRALHELIGDLYYRWRH